VYKPAILATDHALRAIQNNDKLEQDRHDDDPNNPMRTSFTAYSADE